MSKEVVEVPFEKLLEQLETLVTQLEKGDLSLENSLKAYENGVALVRESEKRLSQMELRVEELLADGQVKPLAGDTERANVS